MKRLTELMGLALVVTGVGAIYWQAAIIAAGLGFVLWAQGGDE